MSQLLLTALSLMLLALAKGDHPLSWYREMEVASIDDVVYPRDADKAYRLPENVVPLEYDIYIDLYFRERTEKPFSYEGRENIIIEVVEDNVSEIILHANVDSINVVSLFNEAGVPIRLNPLRPYETIPLYHFLKINLAETLIKDAKYTLYIAYSGTMNEGPMKRGIWRGWYTDDNGNERIYATTHFQPYNARQAFPCWDEPLFKSVFKLHLSRPTSYAGTFTNTRMESSNVLFNNRVVDNFLATPKMSTYLVTFLVSETFQTIAEDVSHTPPIRIIGRSNIQGLGDHALNLAVKLTEFFDDYFQIPYSTLHPNLLNDHIVSPDWASAATENWGMVSYRELHLIIDRRVTIMSVEHYSATLVSHELAHKWFGNLVTCYWWSNTWINEGYASYFGYMGTHVAFPEYELHEHFNSRYLQTSLSFDSGVNTVPMNHDVNTPAEVTGHFGTISYSKAASFLRMTANIITPETFRKACQIFLRNNPFAATDQYDLLDAFVTAIEEDNTVSMYEGFSFPEYYQIWVNDPGYPILNVDVNHDSGQMALTQERFFLSSTAEPTGHIYPIPITFSTSRNSNFNELKPDRMMTVPTLNINKPAGEEWVIFNHLQHGHYRVNYDTRTWELISEALINTPNEIHHLNRAQIVDDVFALMRSGRMSYEFGFSILRFLENENNFHVWDPAISGYTWLRNRLRHIPDKQAEFDAYILKQLDHAVTSLGINPAADETPTVSMARQNILQFACTLGHVKCVQDTWDKFVDWRNNNNEPEAVIRRNVYMTGMREGDQNDFQFLLDRFRTSNIANDNLEMLRGLGATTSPELLSRYLAMTLTKNVRSHDKLNSFNYALLGNQENAVTVLQFVKNHIYLIRQEYVEDSPARPVHTALSNLASYLNEPELAEYEDWLRTTQSDIPQFATAISGIASARANIAWGTANADILLAAARGGATTIAVSMSMLIIMVLLSIFN